MHVFVDVKVVIILKLHITMIRNVLGNSYYHVAKFNQVIAQAEF